MRKESVPEVVAQQPHACQADAYCKQCKEETCDRCAIAQHYRHLKNLEHQSIPVLETLNLLTKYKAQVAMTLQLLSSSRQLHKVDVLKHLQQETMKGEYQQLIAFVNEHKRERLCRLLSRTKDVLVERDCNRLALDALLKEGRRRFEWLSTCLMRGHCGYDCLLVASGEEIVRQKAEARHLRSCIEELRRRARKASRIADLQAQYTKDSAELYQLCRLEAGVLMRDKLVLVRKNHHELWVYYPDLGRSRTVRLTSGFTSPMNFGMAEIAGRTLYLVGGNRSNALGATEFVPTVTAIDLEHNTVWSKAPLHVSRRRAGVAATSDRELFAIGGDKETGCLDSCEVYDIKEDQWRPMARLNEPKTNTSVGTFEERHIYVFGGYNKDSCDLATIERFDTSRGRSWHKVVLTATEPWSARQNTGAMQIGPDEILVWGGMRGGQLLKESVVYRVSQRSFQRAAEMRESDTFLQVRPITSGHYIYSFSCHKYDIHVYNLLTHTWTLIPNSEWYSQRDV